MDCGSFRPRRREILNDVFSRARFGTHDRYLTGVELSFVVYSTHASADPTAVSRNARDNAVSGDQDAWIAVTNLTAFQGCLLGGKCALPVSGAPCQCLFARSSLGLIFRFFPVKAHNRIKVRYRYARKCFLQRISENLLKRDGIDGACGLIILCRWRVRDCGYRLKIELTFQRRIFPRELSATRRFSDLPPDLAQHSSDFEAWSLDMVQQRFRKRTVPRI